MFWEQGGIWELGAGGPGGGTELQGREVWWTVEAGEGGVVDCGGRGGGM